MRSVQNLGPGYREIYSVNLQKNGRVAIFVNVLSLVIAAAMLALMNGIVPFSTFWAQNNTLLKSLVLIGSLVAYLYLHELVHGVTMKACGTKKVHYGFTGLYAFAGSDDYYDKTSYIAIALAPIVVFLFVFAILNLLVPPDWFWVIYLLQVCNVSGAAGDIFVTVKFARMPKDILVKDTGIGMTVYSKE